MSKFIVLFFIVITFLVSSTECLYSQLYVPVSILKLQAYRGDEVAQLELGNAYFWGRGTKKSIFDAFRWYKTAAENGDVIAANNLGGMYYRGEGIGKNIIEGFAWFLVCKKYHGYVRNSNIRSQLKELTRTAYFDIELSLTDDEKSDAYKRYSEIDSYFTNKVKR